MENYKQYNNNEKNKKLNSTTKRKLRLNQKIQFYKLK